MARQDTIKKETAQKVSSVESKEVVPDRKKAEGKDYLFPPASLLIKEEQGHSSGQQQYLQETAQKLYETLTGIQMGHIEAPEGWIKVIK